ncbi:MAG: BatA and WFA domain-containing protein [Bacteroidota bacterium]|nr:BatA and WFA domain-containing protein [Bacteroidota bacterium]
MQFLHPAFLYGLFLVTIPVIIHLFKLRRYQTVYFSNLKFLSEAQTSHKNKARLRDILLLIIRSLLIVMLVLAFAQPFRPGDSIGINRKSEVVGIHIDHSLSMKNQGINGSLLDQAKRMALEIVRSFPLETSFMLIQAEESNTLDIKMDRFEIEEKIRVLEFTSISTSLNNLLEQLHNKSSDSPKQSLASMPVYVFSDFQKSFLDPLALPDSSHFNIIIQNLTPQNANNIFIDTCWLTMPVHHLGSRIHLSAKITNTGEQAYQQFPVSLTVNDSLVAQTTIIIPESSSTRFNISYLPVSKGWQECELHFNDYPVDFDNSFYFSFSLNEQINICHLYDKKVNAYIEAAFDDDSLFVLSSYPSDAYPESDFSKYQTLIISNLSSFEGNIIAKLEDFVSMGGNLILFPPENGSQLEMNRLSNKLGAPGLLEILNRKEMVRFSKDMEDFFQEISLNQETQLAWPLFSKYFRVSNPGNNTRTLLETQTGRPVLLQTKYGNGSFNLAAFALSDSYSSLPEHPLFIPVIYYMSTAETRSPHLYSRINSSSPYPFRNQKNIINPVEFFDQNSQFSVIPQQESKQDEQVTNIYLNDWHGEAGFLMAGWHNEYYEPVALNYDKDESLMNYYSKPDLEDIVSGNNLDYLHLQSPVENISGVSTNHSPSSGLPLAKTLLLISLFLIIFESLIFRLKS